MSRINRWLPILLIVGLVAVAFVAFGQRPMPREVVREADEPDLELLAFSEEAVIELIIAYGDAPRGEQENAQRNDPQQDAHQHAQHEAQQDAQREAQREAQRVAQQEAPQHAQHEAQQDAQREAQREAQRVAQQEAPQHAQHEAQQDEEQGAHRVVLRPRRSEDDDGTITWTLIEPFTAAADDETIATAVSGLASLHAFRYIDPDDAHIDIAAFGLNPPLITMEIHVVSETPDAAIEKQVLYIGEATPIMVGEHETFYVQLPGSDDVYLAGGPALSLINVPVESLIRDEAEVPIDDERPEPDDSAIQ